MRAFNLLAVCFLPCMCVQALAQAAPSRYIVQPSKEPLAEKDGLKVSIAPTFRGKRKAIRLSPGDAHINVVLQNTSSKPLNIVEEWNSWGSECLTLEITKIDGKPLTRPIKVSRQVMIWRGNVFTTEVIEPGEAIVREVQLYIPAQVFNPDSPVTRGDEFRAGHRYVGFPFPKKDGESQVTMRAVFMNGITSREHEIWTGNIASPANDYRVSWNHSVQ